MTHSYESTINKGIKMKLTSLFQRKTAAGAALFSLLFAIASVQAGKATKVQDALWGDGELYDTVLTDTMFHSPPLHSTDVLFDFGMSGLTGQRGVSESVPGDPDYNGGRWRVFMVVFTADGINVHDPDGDGAVNFELTSAEEVMDHADLGHLEIAPTDVSFECPMIPNHGQ